MNSTQKLVSLISGYSLEGSGAKDEGYYDIEKGENRVSYLLDVVNHNEEIGIDANILLAYKFLETDFYGSSQMYHAFKELDTNMYE